MLPVLEQTNVGHTRGQRPCESGDISSGPHFLTSYPLMGTHYAPGTVLAPPTHTVYLIFNCSLADRCGCYAHFTHEETGSARLRNSPKVTQQVNGRTRLLGFGFADVLRVL